MASSSSLSTTTSDESNQYIADSYQDKILDQCIVGGKAAVTRALSSAVNIPMGVRNGKKHQGWTSAFGTEYTVENAFVSDLVEKNIIPRLGQQANSLRYGSQAELKNEPSRCRVHDIIEKCSISGSKMDIAFLSHDGRLLLGTIEAKQSAGDSHDNSTKKAIKKMLCYTIVPLAFSLWGKLKDSRNEIVSLVAFPTSLYRLTLTKSDRPFGLNLRIETTDNINTMNHVLDEYVDGCKQIYLELESGAAKVNETPYPLDWSHVNFDFEDGIKDKFSLTAQPNLGFVFRAMVETVRAFERTCSTTTYCSELPTEEAVILKHYSNILDFGCEWSVTNVRRIIEFTKTKRALEALEAALAENKANKALTNRLQNSLFEKSIAGPTPMMEGGCAQAVLDSMESDDSIQSDDLRSDGAVSSKKAGSIKHPYIALFSSVSKASQNHVAVMFYMGPSLSESTILTSDWLGSEELRRAFFEDIGQSALNLVEKLNLCHNDIRPSNITKRENRFCLIDYDNCRDEIAPAFDESPVLDGVDQASDAMMMLSIAQMALVCFGLESSQDLAREAWEAWLDGGGGPTAGFDCWVAEVGLGDVFARSRPAEQQYGRGFMDERLRRMLRLGPARL